MNTVTWASAPDILTVDEAAALVRIPRTAAYEAIRLGLLPAVNFGVRRTRISKKALQRAFGIGAEEAAMTAAFNRKGE